MHRALVGVLSLALLAPLAAAQGDRVVKLPLKEYLALVEKAELAARAAARPTPAPDPVVAEVTAQRSSIRLLDDTAEVTTTYEVELRGEPLKTVTLPLTGVAATISVTPPGAAAVTRTGDGLSLVATAAGHYTVTITGAALLATSAGVSRLVLAAVSAPVAVTRVDLPASLAWACPGATVAGDTVSGDRRLVELATARGTSHTLEVRRQITGSEADKTMARTVVISIVTVRPEGVRRHEVVLYEVSRGSLPTLSVTLPEGFELDRLASDEGELPPFADSRTIVVQRTTQLVGTGYLVATSTAAPATHLSMDPVVPEVETRARYLALAATVAAEASPEPGATWQRVDIGDLPEMVSSAAGYLKLAAVWQAGAEVAGARLALTVLPPAPELTTVVTSRDTTTLLTLDGTLLHRDRFVLTRAGAALELVLAADATLWSAAVDGLPLRPVERNGATLVPLALGTRPGTTVEVVVVQQHAIPEGRSTLSIALPVLGDPVLKHTWRVLLPEQNSYRFAAGTLTPAPEEAHVSAGADSSEYFPGPAAPAQVPLPSAGYGGAIEGRVTDGSDVLPGVTVTLSSPNLQGARTALTTRDGTYLFKFLPPGEYRVRLELQGFTTLDTSVVVVAGSAARVDAVMPMVQVAEEITVSGEYETISTSHTAATTVRGEQGPSGGGLFSGRKDVKGVPAPATLGYSQEVKNLKQGLVGGVRPVPVTIPETGKALVLAGALPPARVTVELDVKARK